MNKRYLIILFAIVTVLGAVVPFAINRLLAAKIRPPEGTQLAEFAKPPGDVGPDGEPVVEPDAAGPHAARPGSQANRPRKPTLDSYMRPIMDRSLFDSSKVGSTGEAIAGGGEGMEQEATDLGATLILTSVALDPQWSTALILAEADADFPDVFAIGDALADAKVEIIERRRVYLRRQSGSLEYLEIGGEKGKKKRSAVTEATGTKKRGRTDWSEGITKIDDTHYQIDRSALDNALGQLDRLSRDARVVPNYQDGKTNGFKIFSIKRNSAYKHLGLKNNDVLSGVNGMEIRDPKIAMDVYNKLQSESSVSLEVIRKGETMTIEYDIQ